LELWDEDHPEVAEWDDPTTTSEGDLAAGGSNDRWTMPAALAEHRRGERPRLERR
jgi:hypothetical protein